MLFRPDGAKFSGEIGRRVPCSGMAVPIGFVCCKAWLEVTFDHAHGSIELDPKWMYWRRLERGIRVPEPAPH